MKRKGVTVNGGVPPGHIRQAQTKDPIVVGVGLDLPFGRIGIGDLYRIAPRFRWWE
jgi:hypothetical protein